MPDLLDVKDVTVQYGRAIIGLRGASIHIQAGERVGIVGANGAGKTTLVRAITGFLPLERAKVIDGSVKINGKEVRGSLPGQISKLGVVAVPERQKVFSTFSISDHLDLARADRDVASLHQSFAQLIGMQERKAGELSGGQRQLLAIMCALGRKPQLLIVDEFSLGLSPAAIGQVSEAVSTASDGANLAVVLVEQNIEIVRRLCKRVYVMRAGQVVWSGAVEDLSDAVLEEGYFQ